MTTALIAGGGVGGLTAALCLARQGLDVTVLEQSQTLTKTGAGIQLSPNCSRVLHALGLEDALKISAFLPEGTQFRHWRTAKVISDNTLGEVAFERYGAPYYHVHRGDLLRILAQAVNNTPQISMITGERVESFQTDSTSVEVTTSKATHAARLLIGADGIHSQVRAQLWGAQEARFTGNIAWRALVPAERLPKGMIRPMSTVWWGPGKHFVHYYVRGGDLVNCVCVVEKSGWETESWTEPGEVAELRRDFAGWHGDIQTLIDNADHDSFYKWALFDREPMQRWGSGPVTLLGDACHPTLPFMAQGAAMAIEDGAVLANCLVRNDDVGQALKDYENLRRTRTAGIQNGSRRNAKVFHLSGIKAWLRNRAAAGAGGRVTDTLFRYNALDVGK